MILVEKSLGLYDVGVVQAKGPGLDAETDTADPPVENSAGVRVQCDIDGGGRVR